MYVIITLSLSHQFEMVDTALAVQLQSGTARLWVDLARMRVVCVGVASYGVGYDTDRISSLKFTLT